MALSVFASVAIVGTKGNVNAEGEDTSEEVSNLIDKNYEFELTRVLIQKEGKDKPEVVVLEEVEQEKGFVSSKELENRNSETIVNYMRYDRLREKLKELSGTEGVERVQPSYIYSAEAWTRDGDKDTPNDFDLNPSALAGNHWYYERSNLRKMWMEQDCLNDGENCGGSSEVVVAVIDTGLAFEDYTSAWPDQDDPFVFDQLPDMFSGGSINLYTNDDEIPNNQIDDDDNGYVDDYHGANTDNYVRCSDIGACNPIENAETGHPNDDGGHGTFVTGLIASLVDNGSGSVSPAHNVTIMPIKANNEKRSTFSTLELVVAIDYAIYNGADIINMSLSGCSEDAFLETFVNIATENGVLVIASSGNTSVGCSSAVGYPAAYPNVIAVGSVNSDNTRSWYSKFGEELDLVAYVGPGGGKGNSTYQMSYSCFGQSGDSGCYESDDPGVNLDLDPLRYTKFGGKYGIGTSFAAPQVAAAAAIILGNNPGISLSELKLGLLSSTNDVGTAGFDIDTGFGVIDFSKANQFDKEELDIENLTVYRYFNGDRAWIWIGNPSETDPVFVNVNIAGDDMGTHVINPQVNLPLSYKDLFTGPVRITGSAEIHVSHKARSPNGKLNETVAIPASDYGMEFYYPIYRYVNGDGAWLWVANPSQTEGANVSITLNHQDKGVHTVGLGGLKSFSFPEEFSGPLVVNSNKSTFTTLKMRTGGGLEELTGISLDDFATTIYYPVYRYVQGDGAWIWVGNPNSETEANISVEIAGSPVGNYILPPGENISVSYPGVFDGPVVIQSDQEIYSTMKARTGGVINEFRGLGENDFATVYHYPIYRYVNGDGAWIWVGNPEAEETEIDVYIAGELMGSYTIAGEDQIALSYPGVFTGPVKIVSETPIYSTLKSRSFGTLNEFAGIHD